MQSPEPGFVHPASKAAGRGKSPVWAASIPDKPGGLAGAPKTLRDVGADQQLIIARRSPDKPGEGVVFVTPLQGDREMVAAAVAGFNIAQKQHCVRVLGSNQPGLAAALTEDLVQRLVDLEPEAQIPVLALLRGAALR